MLLSIISRVLLVQIRRELIHTQPYWRKIFTEIHMGVSKNSGTPKPSILIGFSIRNHPFWGTTIFGNIHIIWCIYFITFQSFMFGFQVLRAWNFYSLLMKKKLWAGHHLTKMYAPLTLTLSSLKPTRHVFMNSLSLGSYCLIITSILVEWNVESRER